MSKPSLWRPGVVVALCAAAFVTGVFAPRVRSVFAADPVSFQDIEESLTCQCGCGLTVHSCNHLQCGSALPLRQEIRDQMALGKSKPEILGHFKGKYGEKILSAPTASGFNILAWVTPFVLVALGLLVVAVAVTRWSGHRHGAAPTGMTEEPRAPSPYDEILKKELKDFEG
jgi:cytochrome c-type biogenesis protein CcmH